MKKLVKGIVVISLPILLLPTLNVKASNDGLELITETYELSKEYAIKNNKVLYSENSYIETSIHYVNDEVVDIVEKDISKYEFENSNIRSTCEVPGASDCWETNSKIVSIAV